MLYLWNIHMHMYSCTLLLNVWQTLQHQVTLVPNCHAA